MLNTEAVMLRFFSGLLLGGGAVGLMTMRDPEPPLVTLSGPDRLAIIRLESRAAEADRQSLKLQGDLAELWLLGWRQRETITRLQAELDAARRGGAWPLVPAEGTADVAPGDRIPPQQLPIRPTH